MKKVVKVLLISLGAIALVAGISGAVYGSSSSLRNWIDKHTTTPSVTETSQTSSTSDSSEDSSSHGSSSSENGSSSENNGSSSESPGSSETPGSSENPGSSDTPSDFDDENCSISLSTDHIYLRNNNLTLTESDEFSATIEGNPSDNRLVWYPINGNILSVSKTITESEESLTLSASYFNTTQYVRVAMVANPSVYEDLSVTYVNNVKNAEIISVGIFNKSGTSVQSSCTVSSYEPSARDCTWTDHDGTYFHSDKIYRSNDRWYSNPALAMEQGCMVEVTASPGAYIDFKGRIETYKRADTPIFSPEYQFDGSDYSTFTVSEYTDIDFASTYVYYQSYSDLWDIHYRLQLPLDFEGQTGTVVLKLQDWYYAIHFNAYHGVTGMNGVEESVDFGGN